MAATRRKGAARAPDRRASRYTQAGTGEARRRPGGSVGQIALHSLPKMPLPPPRPVDQADVIAWLATPAPWGGAGPVERIDTHTSVVFLVGERTFKLKRAVRFDYLDYSTPERRRRCCLAEVRLNRRTAPQLYLGVRTVSQAPSGGLAIDGEGRAVDYLVEMKRFADGDQLDRLAERGALDVALMPQLADAVVRLHDVAERSFRHGGRDGMAAILQGLRGGLREHATATPDAGACEERGKRPAGDPAASARRRAPRGPCEERGERPAVEPGRGHAPATLDAAACERWSAASFRALDRRADLLDARREAGLVRHGHGDLHLRNICLLDHQPVLFDCIEFNPAFACLDVMYDLAFLLMDLLHRGLAMHANAVLNRYVERTDDSGGLALLPLFLATRAAIRARTEATAARMQPRAADADALRAEARRYLDLAQALMAPCAPRLVAVGGPSGSGKTTLARRLAPAVGPAPGAVVLRSDVERKRLMGVPPERRLGPDGYTASVTRVVYGRLVERADAALGAGHGVIVDAVFGDPAERAAVQDLARAHGVRFDGLWLDAPLATLQARIGERVGDASDATAEVAARQVRELRAPDAWTALDAAGDAAALWRTAQRLVDGRA